MTVALTRAELLELADTCMTTDLVTAGRAWGIGRTKVFELAAAGELPFPVNRLGAAYRVPVEPLLRSLGITPDMREAGPASPATATTTTAPVEDRQHECAPHSAIRAV